MNVLRTAGNEKLIPLGEVPKLLAGPRFGRRIARSTVHRWVHRGVRGVQLEVLRVGGTYYTSEEALFRFFERITEADAIGTVSGAQSPHKSPLPDAKTAERELDRAGIR